MNRTIKFRGKDVETGGWLDGGLILPPNKYPSIVTWKLYKNSILTHNFNVVFPDTVGQFTGLFDKNGKEIYEGDILKGFDITLEVWYSEEKACFIAEMKEPQNDMVDILSGYDTARMEIVGNIYDNPELIKEE